MKDALKKIFLMGVGAASLTRKKAQQTVKMFVNKGVIDKKQAKEFVDKVMSEAGKVKNKLTKEGKKEISRIKKEVINKGKKAKNSVSRKIDNITRRIIRKGMKI